LGTFRFLLALSVALSHFGGVFGYYMMNGRMAVQCFYMVSGFLISLVLAQKYDATTADGRWLFYSNRALRIFVPYWSFCLMILAAQALVLVALGVRVGGSAALAGNWAEMTLATRVYLAISNAFILTQEWSMWLAYDHGALVPVWSSDGLSPHLGEFQIIPQAWSISLELMFYALAPFLVRRHWLTLLGIIVASYLLRYASFAHGFTGSGFVYRFFPFELGLFLAGVLSHRVYAWMVARGLASFPVALAVTAALVGAVMVEQYLDRLDNHKFYILVVIALPAAFEVSRRLRLDRWLGELSYPIYLAHLAVGQVAWTVAGSDADRNWLVLATVATVVLIAVAYVRFVDLPFERWRQRRATQAEPRPALEPFARPGLAAVSRA